MHTITPKNNLDINLQQSNQAIGKELWEKLDFAELLELTKEVQPIIIESDDAQTLQLPWELLFHPTYGFLAQHPNFTLSRKIPNLPNGSTPLEKRPLRVLFFSTLPDDIGEKGRLSVEKEQEVVLLALLEVKQKGLVEITMPNDGRFESLKTLIERDKPDMVFLSGHSSYSEGKGSFLFEDKRGLGVSIDEETLNSAFVGSSVECVVLSSCQSAMASDNELKSGLVMSLTFSGIKNVIGMRESVYDEAGIVFAQNFVEQVARKKSVAQAVQKARHEIYLLTSKVQEHWHLPLLVSPDVNRPLVDWDFVPTPPSTESLNQKLNQILYPSIYVGRRKEFRKFYNQLYGNTLKKLLLYGEGGIGKTAMVAKFGIELRKEEYKVFDYSLKHGGDFDDFLLDIELELSEANSKKFMLIKERCSDETCIVKQLTKLLLEEHKKVAFIFDNLESVQDPITKEITDIKLKAWIETLSNMDNVVLLMTSRWLLPNCEHAIALNRPLKSDFLYFVSMQNIKFTRKDKLDKIYETFGGNYRGVGFFIKAIENMNELDEEQFLAKLSEATRDIQIDMSIAKILSYLSQEERDLLERITVYHVPIPQEGVRKIALDLPKEGLARLVSFSLVEKSYNVIYEVDEYQVSALVLVWLKNNRVNIEGTILILASDYLFWLFIEERKNLTWGLIAYETLKKLKQVEVFEEWLFDEVKNNDMYLRGVLLSHIGSTSFSLFEYKDALKYLKKSLKIAQYLEDKLGEESSLGNISKIYILREEYAIALKYLEKGLKISLDISNKLGEAIIRNNISQIYKERNDYVLAEEHLYVAYKISKDLKDRMLEATALSNVGEIYISKEKYKEALDILDESLRIHKELGNRFEVSIVLSHISLIYSLTNVKDKALNYLKDAKIIQEEFGDSSELCFTLFNIGLLHFSNNEIERATTVLISSSNMANSIGDVKCINMIKSLFSKLGIES